MAYYSGTANSIGDLQSVLRNACVASGFTLSGEVLHKGTLYVDTSIRTGVVRNGQQRDYLTVQAGLGIGPGNELVGGPGWFAALGPLGRGSGTAFSFNDFVWPVTYDIHINSGPDEVWMVVNHNGAEFQHLAFGQSPAPGCPGTGNWHYATCWEAAVISTGDNPIQEQARAMQAPGGSGNHGGSISIWMPFWNDGNSGFESARRREAFHGMDSSGNAAWSRATGTSNPAEGVGVTACISTAMWPLLGISPNAWNGQSTLLPMHVGQRRPENKYSLVGTIEHARMIRNDYLVDRSEVALPPDVWRIYPVKRKDATADINSTAAVSHSSRFAIAVRRVD